MFCECLLVIDKDVEVSQIPKLTSFKITLSSSSQNNTTTRTN